MHKEMGSRGQATIEYLMNHAWVIALIIVAGVAIFALDIGDIKVSIEGKNPRQYAADVAVVGHTCGGTSTVNFIKTLDTPGEIGLHTSISAVGANNVFISYRDDTNTDLKVANTSDGGVTWSTSIVNILFSSSHGTSIDMVDSNTIYIAHTDGDAEIYKSTNGGNSWARTVVDTAGATGYYVSLDALDANTVYMSYQNSSPVDDLVVSKTTDGSTWTVTNNGNPVDSVGNLSFGTSIAVMSATKVYVAYSDITNRDLKFASTSDGGTTWSVSAIASAGAVGDFPSMAAVDANTIYIASNNASDSGLSVGKSTNGGSSWVFYLVDSAGDTGKYPSLKAVDANNVYVTYFDDTNDRLKFAKTTDGGTTWTTRTVGTTGGTLAYPAIYPVNQETIYISFYNNSASDLGVAKSVDGGRQWTTGEKFALSVLSKAASGIKINTGWAVDGVAGATGGGSCTSFSKTELNPGETATCTATLDSCGSVGNPYKIGITMDYTDTRSTLQYKPVVNISGETQSG